MCPIRQGKGFANIPAKTATPASYAVMIAAGSAATASNFAGAKGWIKNNPSATRNCFVEAGSLQ